LDFFFFLAAAAYSFVVVVYSQKSFREWLNYPSREWLNYRVLFAYFHPFLKIKKNLANKKFKKELN